MFIKNTGNKIVHIGSTMILPDKTGEVSGEMTAPLAILIRHGALEVVKAEPHEEAAPPNDPDDTGDSKDSGKKNAKPPAE